MRTAAALLALLALGVLYLAPHLLALAVVALIVASGLFAYDLTRP